MNDWETRDDVACSCGQPVPNGVNVPNASATQMAPIVAVLERRPCQPDAYGDVEVSGIPMDQVLDLST